MTHLVAVMGPVADTPAGGAGAGAGGEDTVDESMFLPRPDITALVYPVNGQSGYAPLYAATGTTTPRPYGGLSGPYLDEEDVCLACIVDFGLTNKQLFQGMTAPALDWATVATL